MPLSSSALAACNDNFYWKPTQGTNWHVNANWADVNGNAKNDWPNAATDCVFLGVNGFQDQTLTLVDIPGVDEVELDTFVVGDQKKFSALHVSENMKIREFRIQEGYVEISENNSIHVHSYFSFDGSASDVASFLNQDAGEIWVYGINGNVADAIFFGSFAADNSNHSFDARLVVGSHNESVDGLLSATERTIIVAGPKADFDILPGGKLDAFDLNIDHHHLVNNPNAIDIQGEFVLEGDNINTTSSISLPIILEHLDDTYDPPSMVVDKARLHLSGVGQNANEGSLHNVGGEVKVYPYASTGGTLIAIDAEHAITQVHGGFDPSRFIFGYNPQTPSQVVVLRGDMLFTGGNVEFDDAITEAQIEGRWYLDGADIYANAQPNLSGLTHNVIEIDDMHVENADLHMSANNSLAQNDEFAFIVVTDSQVLVEIDFDSIIGTPYVGGHFEDEIVEIDGGSIVEYRLKAVDDAI